MGGGGDLGGEVAPSPAWAVAPDTVQRSLFSANPPEEGSSSSLFPTPLGGHSVCEKAAACLLLSRLWWGGRRGCLLQDPVPLGPKSYRPFCHKLSPFPQASIPMVERAESGGRRWKRSWGGEEM